MPVGIRPIFKKRLQRRMAIWAKPYSNLHIFAKHILFNDSYNKPQIFSQSFSNDN